MTVTRHHEPELVAHPANLRVGHRVHRTAQQPGTDLLVAVRNIDLARLSHRHERTQQQAQENNGGLHAATISMVATTRQQPNDPARARY